MDVFRPQIRFQATNQFWDCGGFSFDILCFTWWDIHDHCPEKEQYNFAIGQLIFSDDFGMPDG